MDFYQVKERVTKNGVEVYPDFTVGHSRDLMIRGRAFYAIWDEASGLWSTDELDACRIIDESLHIRARELQDPGVSVHVLELSSYNSRTWTMFRNYCASLPDTNQQLDSSLAFANTPVRREDYSSKRLPYSLEPGPFPAYEKLMGRLFDPEERQKLEWATGSVISGDSKRIEKFVVLFGEAGTGKSTFLRILQQLCEGYWTVFNAKELTARSNTFATEAFKSNPLVAIQHDGDLSRIEDNTILNTIVSHEPIAINEKYRAIYTSRINAFLFIGTNQSVRITDAKSGLIRRLINVNPTGETFTAAEYNVLVNQVGSELGGIATHCLSVYRSLGKNHYVGYRPIDMMVRTDIFYNFMMANFDMLKQRGGITLKEAWNLYKEYCDESGLDKRMYRVQFRDELRNYFSEFQEKARVNGLEVRSLFTGFKTQKLNFRSVPEPDLPSLTLDEKISLLDKTLADMPAQYANGEGVPFRKWEKVKTVLSDLDTSRLHYVKPGLNHIVIDFDLKGVDGEKSTELNLEAASRFPPTYSEFSQSGSGIHLHYIYAGDVAQLSRVYDYGIEVKVFSGDSSLRRKLTRCNNVPVATINGGLPLKDRRVISTDSIKSERGLRNLILRNLHKEIHPGTKPSVDFIKKILDEASVSGMPYDITDMRSRILAFANNSTNHAASCIKQVTEMKFAAEGSVIPVRDTGDDRLVFYDVEVFPNLLVVCWKYKGDANVVKMINPPPADIEALAKTKLVGFYVRRYDNHILYARMMGYSEMDLFKLSQRILAGEATAFFGDAYNLSYADVWDISSKKQSLKLFQIELGLNHRELGLPWDEPVDPSLWEMVADYCANDVITTEQVADARQQDFAAREILASLSGLTVNDTTQKHTAKIVFGNDRNPQEKFKYTDLSTEFPGYVHEFGKSIYKGEETGEGGYVYAEPGMYTNVAVLDVASMHPTSIELLDMFGPYTKKFSELKDARIAIKRRDYGRARELLGGAHGQDRELLGGALRPHLSSADDAEALSYALKIVINIVYGLTSASFENPFRDPRNIDNIVAKRGALFMIDLKEAVQEQGFKVVHIKTDSVKIPDATPEIIEFVMNFGRKYGYDFEHEVTYEKFCLVNDAVYIAKTEEQLCGRCGEVHGEWTATGAQFQHPYVFKTLFSKERVVFDDLRETRSVTTALYLDFGEGDPHFVGRAGAFVPVRDGTGGGSLLRIGKVSPGTDPGDQERVFHSASGAKGYFWREAAAVRELGLEADIDMSYYQKMTDEAVTSISRFGDFEWFTS